MWRVGEHAEGIEVRDEPDLADGPHPRDRLQLVEPAHRLHRDREPDPRLEPSFQAVPAGRLRAHRAVVAAPEEPDEPQSCFVGPGGDLGHGSRHRRQAWRRAGRDATSRRDQVSP